MRFRSPLLGLALVLGVFPVGAQDLGRADRLRQEYLAETVRRGEPLVALTGPGLVPYWPRLDRAWADAASLDPGADVDLVGAWMGSHEGDLDASVRVLKAHWPLTEPGKLSPRAWGETLFTLWNPGNNSHDWTQAWLAWEAKAFSPAALVRGLEVLEKSDASAVEPLLKQALQLYPEDRRFLPLVVRHPAVVRDPVGILARDLATSGGFGPGTLGSWLDRDPSSRNLLTQAGYSAERLDRAMARDYSAWLVQKDPAAPADGEWTWDADGDGRSESRLVFRSGRLVSWSKASDDGAQWTLSLGSGLPVRLEEDRSGASWILDYESYPWVRTLEYRWGALKIVYRFAPLAQSVPLGPAERFQATGPRLPATLAVLWAPLDPLILAQASASVETYEGQKKVRTVYLAGGQVWLAVEDSNRDGLDDSWTYYRSGLVDSVYRDPAGQGQASLRELYEKGLVVQVQSLGPGPKGPEFVLFPQEGVQLWDPHGDRRPLERLFVWSGQDSLQALVFSGPSVPWATMPTWEPRP